MLRKLERLWPNRDCQDVVSQHTPSEAAFEIVERDAAVRADGIRDPLTTNSRLVYGLQRLFEPVSGDPLYRLDHLLMLLDRQLSKGIHKELP
jgi:hypothetical protein